MLALHIETGAPDPVQGTVEEILARMEFEDGQVIILSLSQSCLSNWPTSRVWPPLDH